MLFGLKKLISYWLMPLPFCLAVIVIGVLLLRSARWPRAGRRLIIAGVLLLLVFSNKQVGRALLRPLENQYAPIPEYAPDVALPAALAECQAIVVLGGGHADQDALSALGQLSTSSLSRISEAVRLAHLRPYIKVFVSGPAIGPNGRSHANVLATAAASLGIEKKRLVQIDNARDTDDEVQVVKELIGPKVPFALVTSAWHMPRAMALMHRAGLKPLACPADFLSRGNSQLHASDWLWDVSGLQQSTWAIYERLGTTWAKLQGKI